MSFFCSICKMPRWLTPYKGDGHGGDICAQHLEERSICTLPNGTVVSDEAIEYLSRRQIVLDAVIREMTPRHFGKVCEHCWRDWVPEIRREFRKRMEGEYPRGWGGCRINTEGTE